MSDVITTQQTCVVCGSEIPQHDGVLDRCARIERGDFHLSDEDRADDNVKFCRLICQQCFKTDADLCRFFNKLGLRVR